MSADRRTPDRRRSAAGQGRAADQGRAAARGRAADTRRPGRHSAQGWDVEEGWPEHPGGRGPVAEDRARSRMPGGPAGHDGRPGRDDDPDRGARSNRDARSDRSAADRSAPEDRGARAGRDGRTGRGGRTAPRLPLWDRLLRGLAGLLAGGLVALSLGLLVVWLLSGEWGVPGPGGGVVAGHMAGAVVAVLGQRIADRRPDRSGSLAAAAVIATALLVLGLAWFL